MEVLLSDIVNYLFQRYLLDEDRFAFIQVNKRMWSLRESFYRELYRTTISLVRLPPNDYYRCYRRIYRQYLHPRVICRIESFVETLMGLGYEILLSTHFSHLGGHGWINLGQSGHRDIIERYVDRLSVFQFDELMIGLIRGGHLEVLQKYIGTPDNLTIDRYFIAAISCEQLDVVEYLFPRITDFSDVLRISSLYGNLELTRKLLLRDPSDSDVALRAGSNGNYPDIVELAIQFGATDFGSALVNAAHNKNTVLMRQMLNLGTDRIETAFHVACNTRHLEGMDLLAPHLLEKYTHKIKPGNNDVSHISKPHDIFDKYMSFVAGSDFAEGLERLLSYGAALKQSTMRILVDSNNVDAIRFLRERGWLTRSQCRAIYILACDNSCEDIRRYLFCYQIE